MSYGMCHEMEWSRCMLNDSRRRDEMDGMMLDGYDRERGVRGDAIRRP